MVGAEVLFPLFASCILSFTKLTIEDREGVTNNLCYGLLSHFLFSALLAFLLCLIEELFAPQFPSLLGGGDCGFRELGALPQAHAAVVARHPDRVRDALRLGAQAGVLLPAHLNQQPKSNIGIFNGRIQTHNLNPGEIEVLRRRSQGQLEVKAIIMVQPLLLLRFPYNRCIVVLAIARCKCMKPTFQLPPSLRLVYIHRFWDNRKGRRAWFIVISRYSAIPPGIRPGAAVLGGLGWSTPRTLLVFPSRTSASTSSPSPWTATSAIAPLSAATPPPAPTSSPSRTVAPASASSPRVSPTSAPPLSAVAATPPSSWAFTISSWASTISFWASTISSWTSTSSWTSSVWLCSLRWLLESLGLLFLVALGG